MRELVFAVSLMLSVGFSQSAVNIETFCVGPPDDIPWETDRYAPEVSDTQAFRVTIDGETLEPCLVLEYSEQETGQGYEHRLCMPVAGCEEVIGYRPPLMERLDNQSVYVKDALKQGKFVGGALILTSEEVPYAGDEVVGLTISSHEQGEGVLIVMTPTADRLRQTVCVFWAVYPFDLN